MSVPLGWRSPTGQQHPFSLGFLVPVVILFGNEAITKTIASTSQGHILKLSKANAGNSCFCTFIVSYQITIRAKFLVPFDVKLSFVYETYLCEKNSVSHKNESFAPVMYVSERMCQKEITSLLGFVSLATCPFRSLFVVFTFSESDSSFK